MAITLPVEILIAIVKEVDDVKDLRHLRMASRTLCAITTPHAFTALSVTTTSSSAQNIGRLSSSITLILRLIKDCLSLQASILGALADSFSVRAPSKLTSLSLLNLRASDPHPLEALPLQTILTTLQRLRLSAVFDSYPDESTPTDHWHDFWGSLWLRMIPVQMQVVLTDLTLHSNVAVGTDSGLSFSGLHFPRLSALSLRNIVFSIIFLGAEDIILRHAATLTRLQLLTCKMVISRNRLLSLLSLSESTNPATDVELRRRPYWDRVWDHFAAELTGLVALYVDERHIDREYRYVHHRFGGSYSMIYAGESRNAVDLAALQRFRVTVAARSAEMRVES